MISPVLRFSCALDRQQAPRLIYRFLRVTKTLSQSRQIRRNTGWPGVARCSSRWTWLTFATSC